MVEKDRCIKNNIKLTKLSRRGINLENVNKIKSRIEVTNI
jgi:hypothetical protein